VAPSTGSQSAVGDSGPEAASPAGAAAARLPEVSPVGRCCCSRSAVPSASPWAAPVTRPWMRSGMFRPRVDSTVSNTPRSAPADSPENCLPATSPSVPPELTTDGGLAGELLAGDVAVGAAGADHGDLADLGVALREGLHEGGQLVH